MKTQTKNITKYFEVTRQADHEQTELSNMLVKNVLNEINKEGTFVQIHYLKPEPSSQTQSEFPVALDQSIFKVQLD